MKNAQKLNTMSLPVGDYLYKNVPIEVAKAIELQLSLYDREVIKATGTPKATPKPAKAKAEPKANVKVYSKTADGKGVKLGTEGFIPKVVFNGVKYSLKQAGAKWDSKAGAWMFGTKKACTEWCKAQDARG